MWLIHNTKHNLGLRGVLGRNLTPQRAEVGVGNGAVALTDNVSVPARWIFHQWPIYVAQSNSSHHNCGYQ